MTEAIVMDDGHVLMDDVPVRYSAMWRERQVGLDVP